MAEQCYSIKEHSTEWNILSVVDFGSGDFYSRIILIQPVTVSFQLTRTELDNQLTWKSINLYISKEESTSKK